MAAEVGPQCECTDLNDELAFAHNIWAISSHWPSSTQLAAARDCCLGTHNLHLAGWPPRLARDVNALTLPMSFSSPIIFGQLVRIGPQAHNWLPHETVAWAHIICT